MEWPRTTRAPMPAALSVPMESLFLTSKIIYFLLLATALITSIVSWVGMHNNTSDGDTFKLMALAFTLEEDEFNERGKAWRKLHIKCLIALLSLLFILGGYIYAT